MIDGIPMEVIISALLKGVERLHWASGEGNPAPTPLLTAWFVVPYSRLSIEKNLTFSTYYYVWIVSIWKS